MPNTKYQIPNTKLLRKLIFWHTLRRKYPYAYYPVLLIVLLSGLVIVYVSLTNPTKASAAWFNDSWLYRNALTITNNSSADSYKKVKFDIDTATQIAASRMQADCGDSRFTDANGKLLKYYLDSAGGACNTNSTDYYVLVPVINAGSTVIYHYYGNASAPNGTEASQFSQSTFSPNSSTSATQERAPAPIAYFKFDEGFGTTTYDSTPATHSATLAGNPAWQPEDMCVVGRCLNFDGTDDTVVTNQNNNSLYRVNSASWGAWVYPRNLGATAQGIITQTNTNFVDGIGLDFGSGLANCTVSASSQGTNVTATYALSNFKANTWVHLFCSWTAGEGVKLYVNGQLVATSAVISGVLDNQENAPFRIGYQKSGSNVDSRFFNGRIDEVKIYPTAKTADEVKAIYNSRGSGEGAGGTLGTGGPSNQMALSNGLIGYWRFDESPAANAVDASGNGLTLTRTATPANANGKFNLATDLESSSSQYFTRTDSATISLTSSVSLAAWIKPESNTTATAYDIIGKWDTNDESYLLQQYGDELRLYIDSASNYVETTSADLQTGVFYQVVGVYTSTSQSAKIYVDGKQMTTTTTGTIPSSIGDGADKFHIGAEDSTTAATNFYDGLIDDARLYNRALSNSEVMYLANWSPAAWLYWNFDEGSGTSANDKGSDTFIGTLTNGPAWTTGKYGKGVKFDGTDDFVTTADNANLDFGSGIDFTISLWAKHNGAISTNNDYLLSKFSSTTGGYKLWMDNSGDFCFGTDDDATWTPNDSACTSAVDYDDNQWHYVVGRKSASGRLDLIVDGVVVASDTSLAGPGSLSNSGAFYVGIDSDGTSNSWDGWIDDVRVYRYSIGNKKIQEEAATTHPAGSSTKASQLSYYKFNEGTGTTANDSGSAGLSGSISGATWSLDGKYGRALSFDGVDDVTTVTNAPAIDFDNGLSNGVTFSAWVYATSAGEGSLGQVYQKGTNTFLRVKNLSSSTLDVEASLDLTASDATVTVSSAIQTNAWNHLVVAYSDDNDDEVEVYVNGILRGTSTNGSGGPATGDTNNLLIGGTTTANFAGRIDEFKVYNNTLTVNEVPVDMNRGSGLKLGSSGLSASDGKTPLDSAAARYCVPGDTSTATCQPAGEWLLEERSGTSATDSSGNGNTGTLSNSPTWTRGKIGSALSFNGSNQSVSVASTINGVKSVSFWVKPTSTTESMIALTGSARITASGGTISATGFTSPTIYVNGVISSTLTANIWQYITVTTGTGINASALTFGLANSVYFNGLLDQIRMYTYTLSPAQVAWNFSRGKAIAYWKMDECQGGSANDSSGNGFVGTINLSTTGSQTTTTGNGTCTTSAATPWYNGRVGKFNSSINLDGTSDYISISDANALDLTDNLTLSAWVKRGSTGSTQYILNKGTNAYALYFDSSNTINLAMQGTGNIVTSTSALTDTSNWHHIAATWNGTTGKIYLDGVDVSGSTTSRTLAANTTALSIGADMTPANYLNGKIDEVQLFAYPMTPNQIVMLYNQNVGVRFAPVTGTP